jgi:hypothetical protein
MMLIKTANTMPSTVLGTSITEEKSMTPLVPGNDVGRTNAWVCPANDDKGNVEAGVEGGGKDQCWRSERNVG